MANLDTLTERLPHPDLADKIVGVSVLVLGTLMIAGSLWSNPAHAVTYEDTPATLDGWVLLETPKGQYVYGPAKSDGRIKTQAVMIGKPERQEFDYYSPEEVEGLNKLYAKRVAARKDASDKRFYATLQWPKVIVRGNEVCVPESAFADASDWKGHLTCTPKVASADGMAHVQ